MDHDANNPEKLTEKVIPLPPAAAQASLPRGAVTGLTPPQRAEARIREIFPTVVDALPAFAAAGKGLMRIPVLLPPVTWLLAPLLWPVAWLILSIPFLRMLFPFLCKRYTLTNRRLMVQRGLRPSPRQEIPLAEIDDVRFVQGSYDEFFRCATLEVVSRGQTALTLKGVPDAEAYRHAILNAVKAWVPGKAQGPFLPASAAAKS